MITPNTNKLINEVYSSTVGKWRFINLYLSLFLIAIASIDIEAQCFYEGPFTIADLSNNFITLEIEGAVNDDLSDPGQGVCGANIHFNHSAVGDLLITLTSPAGDVITLVGNTSPPPPLTNGANWNISFVPCGLPAAPDSGIGAQWSNNSAWANFGNYTGSYYPFAGCLENFNTGSVNGNWVLYIQDGLEFDVGELLEFSIIFCNPEGIECETCEPDGGFLSGLPYEICQGEQIDNLPEPDYLFSDPPNPDFYDYHYLVVLNDSIIGVLPDDDFVFENAGNHRLYGLSIANRDTHWLDSLAGQFLFSELRSQLSPGQRIFCGDIGLSFVNIFVYPVYDHVVDITICRDEQYVAGDSILPGPGTYFFEFNSIHGCDSIVTINLMEEIIFATAETSDTLSCVFFPATIEASASVLPDSGAYIWLNTDFQVVGDSNTLELVTNIGGSYFFVIESEFCRDTAEVFLSGSIEGTPVQLFADTLDCINNQASLRAVAQFPLLEYNWTGPDGFEGDQPDVTVDTEGWYFFAGLDRDSCLILDSIELIGEFEPPVLVTEVILGDCIGSDVQLLIPEFDSSYQLIWIFEGDSLEGRSPIVNMEGDYELIVEAENGCIENFRVEVIYQYDFPQITLGSLTFPCELDSAELSASSDIAGSEFFWTDSLDFIASGELVNVPDLGTYYLEVVSPAGCSVDTVFEVVSQGNLPDLELILSDTSGCFRDSIQLFSQSNFPQLEYSWTGPGGFSSVEASPWVYQEGQYFVEIFTPGGCELLDSIFVPNEFDISGIEILSDTINCLNPVGNLTVTGPDEYVYTWTFPDMSAEVGQMVDFVDTGLYRLLILNPENFCTATLEHATLGDFESPEGDFVADTISCNDPLASVQFLMDAEVTALLTGPGVLSSTDTEAIVDEPGEYLLIFTALNGCEDSVQVVVEADTALPQIVLNFTNLDCRNDSVSLSFQSDRALESFSWTGPDGFFSDEEVVNAGLPGSYQFAALGLNGCSDTIDFEIEDRSEDLNIVFLGNTTIDCNQPQTVIALEDAQSDYTFEWLGPNGFSSTDEEIAIVEGGWYFLTVTDAEDCAGTDSVFISEDFEFPEFDAVISTITCASEGEINLTYDGIPSFAWTGPEGFSSDEDRVMSSIGGDYQLRITNDNGCSVDTLFVLPIDTISPDISIGGIVELNCDQPTVVLTITNPDSSTIYFWISGSDTIFSTNLTVENAGIYLIEAIASNGCFASDEYMISEDFEVPEFDLIEGEFNCGSATVSLSVESGEDLRSVSWFTDGGIFGVGEEVETTEEGAHFVLVEGINGCIDSLGFEITFEPDFPDFDLVFSEISCAHPLAEVQLTTESQNTFTFTFPDGEEGEDPSFMTELPGEYTLVLTSPNDCVVNEDFIINADTVSPEAVINLISGFDCEEERAVLEAELVNTIDNIGYMWGGPVGSIEGSAAATQLMVNAGGIFTLNIENLDNGCDTELIYVLDSFDIGEANWELSVLQADCRDLPFGEIEIVASSGDFIQPFNYSLNGENWQTESIFNPGVGEWTVYLRDSRNCVADTIIFIDPLPEFLVSIGEDTIVELGENIWITPDVFPADRVYTYNWLGPVDCFDCPEAEGLLEQDEVFRLEVEDVETGCTASATKRVEVTADPRFYIPNVFNPNSQVGNNSFRMYTNSGFIESVDIQIYDRWGNLVFELQNCPVSEECGWDGNFRGEPMAQGVYVYQLVVRTIRGDEIINRGEVLLLN
ncbi:MAG: hypothetical protein EA362_12310 [Saprospirales bacterium]|nr:MAG: hypothetical protein EA362_12310 [Saprospirales bacterium]